MMKELARIVLDTAFDFFTMNPRICDLKHGEYTTFTNSRDEKICEVWSIHSSLILFGFFLDDGFGANFTVESHSSLSDVVKIYPKIQKEHDDFVFLHGGE